MNKVRRAGPFRLRAGGWWICALAWPVAAPLHAAQADQTAAGELLGKAHALEVRGRLNLAEQTWQQVLLVDPNNKEALAGLVRASHEEGDAKAAAAYLARLRVIDPGAPDNPGIAAAGPVLSNGNASAELQNAGRLAEAGEYAQAMAVLRQVYGRQPPPGAPALSYYKTEAALESGRPQAVAALRALVDRFPDDSRYEVALGTILTFNPRTREEGLRLLEKNQGDRQAREALRQVHLWRTESPATAAEVHELLASLVAGQAARVVAQAKAEEPARPPVHLAPLQAAQPLQAGPAPTQPAATVTSTARPAPVAEAMWVATAARSENRSPAAQTPIAAALRAQPAAPAVQSSLGNLLLRKQRPAQALPLLQRAVRLAPHDAAAWEALIGAELGLHRYSEALGAAARIPAEVRKQLLSDPAYLQTMTTIYLATERRADAQRLLELALAQPESTGANGVRAEVQVLYAGLLLGAGDRDGAARIYREAAANDSTNTSAWRGLVELEHAGGDDVAALGAIEQIPPQSLTALVGEPGFASTVALVDQSQGRLDLAQTSLEHALASQGAQGAKPAPSLRMQLAAVDLRRGNLPQAYALFRSVLGDDPGNGAAWEGLLASLHATGHDQEALIQILRIPPDVREQLEGQAAYGQLMVAIGARTGERPQATVSLQRVNGGDPVLPQSAIPPQHAALAQDAHTPDADLQFAGDLFKRDDDAGLYRQLLALGERADLTPGQRGEVQALWVSWTLRSADKAAAAGNSRLSIAILDAAVKALPGNRALIEELGGSYMKVGLPKEAIAIFQSEDLKSASVHEYQLAIGAAIAGGDRNDAAAWLRYGLEEHPDSPEMLQLAARVEQRRGDAARAAEYNRASLTAKSSPERSGNSAPGPIRAAPLTSGQLPSPQGAGALRSLLVQPAATPAEGSGGYPIYLPSHVVATPPVPAATAAGQGSPAAGKSDAGSGQQYPQPKFRDTAHPVK